MFILVTTDGSAGVEVNAGFQHRSVLAVVIVVSYMFEPVCCIVIKLFVTNKKFFLCFFAEIPLQHKSIKNPAIKTAGLSSWFW